MNSRSRFVVRTTLGGLCGIALAACGGVGSPDLPESASPPAAAAPTAAPSAAASAPSSPTSTASAFALHGVSPIAAGDPADAAAPPPDAPPPPPVTAPGSGLPLVFAGVVRSKIDDRCLIFGANGNEWSPSRYLWSDPDPTYCGMSSKADLLSNRQAVWNFTNVGDDNYILTNGSSGIEQCLIFSGNGQDTNPSRYNWGDGSSAVNCGFASTTDLLTDKQAVFRILKVSDASFEITNASSGEEMCLIFSGNGQDANPSRYNWNGTALNCGFPDLASMLDNKQAVWSVEPL